MKIPHWLTGSNCILFIPANPDRGITRCCLKKGLTRPKHNGQSCLRISTDALPHGIYEKLLPIDWLKGTRIAGSLVFFASLISLLKGKKFFRKSRKISSYFPFTPKNVRAVLMISLKTPTPTPN
jgi:hypothetical protein